MTRPVPGVALVTIDRPHKSNAIDPATDRAMGEALAALEQDDDVRCIVLTGAGDKAFCAGADIPELLPHLRRNIAEGRDDPQFCGATHRHETSKPLVAAINGAALGGGLELALACDLRLASSNASFGLPEITVGVLAGGGGCTRLPRTVPAALAAEMILTGQAIDAQRALQAGLVSEVIAFEALLPRALALAQQIATRAPLALRACTELLRRPRFVELQDALAAERAAFARVLLSEDAHEGIRAFAQKRAPVYQAR
ncbi:enoyl-CoA hydratase-related protein [Ramlibacter tataouinensis]|uniref:enoyl-CoA hydratase/isomerase family protein n=1 Tax=Ramlibacter tataouinensis TaxID=94132 RepID=UPI0022F4020A|nr:enoyl-CoA hydratase-related protein [Ramlibacter tataouinensis]WBY03576.1 enoyl-CoA hydratase-related protein [Ramlibacter tataouinensis]